MVLIIKTSMQYKTMNKKLLTLEQIQKKYKDVYIEVKRILDYTSGDVMFEVYKTSKTIRENMTLGQDVGTSNAYRR